MKRMTAPNLKSRWLEQAAKSEFRFAREAGEGLEFWSTVPPSYEWVFDTAETLGPRMVEIEDEAALRALMGAFARDWLAYGHMQIWKIYEMVAGCAQMMNSDLVVAAATPARSAVESTIALTIAAARQAELIQAMVEHSDQFPEKVRESDDFLQRMLWGRKSGIGDVEAINILTLKTKFQKKTLDPDAEAQLEDVYSQLCDIVRPSASGHQAYWGAPLQFDETSPRLVGLEFGRRGAWSVVVAELCLWAIGWSTQQGIRSFRIIRNNTEATHGEW